MVKSGDREILLVNPGAGIYALNNRCTPRGCSLYNGKLEGGNLLCPCHPLVFNVKTGGVVNGPARSRQPPSAVIIEYGEITLVP